MTKRERLAYIAGIIDGEGCISIHSGPQNRNWTIRITVDMQSKKIVDFLVGSFGGHCNRIEKDTAKYAIYYWYMCGSKAYDMLKKIKPYLVEKSAQADQAIRFFIHQKNYRNRKLTNQEIEERERYKIHLREFKTKFLSPKIALAETECENALVGEATVRT